MLAAARADTIACAALLLVGRICLVRHPTCERALLTVCAAAQCICHCACVDLQGVAATKQARRRSRKTVA